MPGWFQQPTINRVTGGGGAGSPIPPTPPAEAFIGVNITGAQNTFPVFASQDCHTYFANRFRGPLNPNVIFRFPFCWSLPNSTAPFTGFVGAQPVAFGPLDTTSTAYSGQSYMDALAQQIQFAINAGAKLILDNHMFGIGPGGVSVGSPTLPNTALADFWGKFAAYLMANPSLLVGVDGLDLMNEFPNGFSSIDAIQSQQLSVTAIRDAGYTGKIYAEGVNFTSAWNWVTGQGNPTNSNLLYTIIDPLRNLWAQPHMYPDYDDSGSHCSYALNIATAGLAPPGLNVNPLIGVQRMTREYTGWQAVHGLPSLNGEYGSSNDSPWFGGAFNFAAWNTITDNMMASLKDNDIALTFWAGGPGFAIGYNSIGYFYSLDSYSTTSEGQPDYTSTGVQHPVWTVIDKYTGYTGPQPTAYDLFQPGLNNPTFYCTVGTPSQPFTIYYGGKITSPVTITPADFLFDGVTSAGGTFTPASVTLAPGDNALATFTYTASQAVTLIISTTNSAGWHDPPPISMSSIVDAYTPVPTAALSNMYGLYNRYSPNTGPSLSLVRPSDGQQLDWGFSLDGKNFDRNAIQTWSGLRSGIPIATIYGIGPSQQNPITFTNPAARPTLNLQNSAGYPQIEVNTAAFGAFLAPINAQHAFTTIYRINQSSSAGMGLYRMDWFTGPIDCTPTGFALGDSANYSGNNVAISVNVVNAAYHEYAFTWADAVTNGFIAYKDGISQNTATYSAPTVPVVVGGTPFGIGLNPAFAANSLQFGVFKFFTGTQWRGVFTNAELMPGYAASPTIVASINTFDAAYYSTPLPDTLAPIAPLIAGTGPNNVTVGFTNNPFSTVTITDQNTGTPTDSVTITLSGSAGGTLSGSGLSGTGPYTLAATIPATITTQLRGLVYTPVGGIATTEIMALAVVSSAGPTANDSNTVSTVIPLANPIITGAGPTSRVVGKTNAPFAVPVAGRYPSATVVITDPNPGSPTETVTLTLSGAAGGTLAGAGLSGSGPYTLGPASAAVVSAQLGALIYTSSGTAGQTETITISVLSSVGSSASDSNSVVTAIAVAGPETPLLAPTGTFTPINKSGPNIIAASGAYPDSVATQGSSLAGFQHIYPQNNEIDYWATKGCGSIRVPLSATRLQPMCYQQLDPPTPRFDGELLNYPGGPYATGTQVNIVEIKRVLDRCRSNNMYCQLEFHQNQIADRQNNKVRTFGTDPEANAIIIDTWQRMATIFQHYDNAIFEYMNEPIADTVGHNFTCQSGIASAIAAITTLQWNYLPTNSFSGGGSYVSRGEPALWNPYVAAAPAGLKWALVVHQYLDFDNAGDTQDVVQGKGSSILTAAIASMSAGGIKASLTETGWSPNDAQPNIGQLIPGGGGLIYGTPSIEGNAILNACKTNPGVMIGWNYWLGGDYVFEAAWNTTTGASILSAVAAGFHPAGTIIDAPQVTVMQANFV